MDSEKERIAKWRAERRQRREEQRKTSPQPYRSLFTIDNDEQTDPPELQEYLVRQNLAKGNRARRMSSGEVRLALTTWGLDELNQLWGMRREKLTYLEDAALLLAEIRHRAGIDPQLRPAAELMDYEAIRALQGVLEENGRLTVEEPLPPTVEAVVAEGKRVEQVLRVIREGQAEFRKRLVAHYGAVCMVTGTAHASVIDAAHIVPYNGASTNALNNGLLLRKDIHALFDAGLLTIGPDLVVYVSAGVDDPFYRSLDGKELTLTSPPKISKDALRRRMAGGESAELGG
ncbi:HNH endonuclease [Stenotrophomonas acidaminiphila]|uniref:HNH endonuclease n=1 Tax=Stenotrophomonas acidaminiphila TaxID=128780 RepID=UPI001375A326|nr:HNH endonuclease signature motif containing protein [Stenotrophomonas acidaminiphila]NCT86890.1 HNH endonuclease [Stenotrophomonas acidaminiphila]